MVYHMVMPRREVLVQLDDELVAGLDRIAARTSVSRSELLRRAALAVIEADRWAQADHRLVEGYTKYPPDPVLVETSRRLAAENVPEW
jgi:metal-responsive CopG/Arc/MetJ family transcriptional regulator